jgi:UDPglucose 6-dehydrogenase
MGVVGEGIAKLFGEQVFAIYSKHLPGFGLFEYQQRFNKTDMTVVCVPTPIGKDGWSCDTSAIESTLEWLEEIKYKGVVLIKSAVVPSEIKRLVKKFPKLRICISPEYMGESKYFTPFWKYPDPKDMRSHTWQVYGGKKEDTSLCVDIFKRKMSVDTIHLQTDIMTAALCKYMENCFFATKVTFCNEWFDIAKLYGVDYNELRECWLADTRINRNHTLVFPTDRGYGGRCYPKDMKAIISDTKKLGYKSELMKTVDKVNRKFRK